MGRGYVQRIVNRNGNHVYACTTQYIYYAQGFDIFKTVGKKYIVFHIINC